MYLHLLPTKNSNSVHRPFNCVIRWKVGASYLAVHQGPITLQSSQVAAGGAGAANFPLPLGRYIRLLVRCAAGIEAVVSMWPRQAREERHGEVARRVSRNQKTHLTWWLPPPAAADRRTHGLYPNRAMVSSQCCQGGGGSKAAFPGRTFQNKSTSMCPAR